jgi:hypothetical protein
MACCKLFDRERFGAFRYVSVLFAALRQACRYLRLQLAPEAPAPHSRSTHLTRLEVGLLPSLLVTVVAIPCFGAPACRYSA